MEVDMKLLKAIIISISIFVFSNIANGQDLKETKGTFGEMPFPVFFTNDYEVSVPTFLFRATQYQRFRLKKNEKKMHESAVYFMLENAPNSKIVSWYSDKRYAGGKVRVIHSYPISGGYCRTYQAWIKVNSKERHMTNNACKLMDGDWKFLK